MKEKKNENSFQSVQLVTRKNEKMKWASESK